MLERLVPFGCAPGRNRRRRPDLRRTQNALSDAYFGRESARFDPATTASGGAARVVVQPDASVMVIGPNPAPAAELAPFCERTNRGAGQGAMVFEDLRDSIVQGGQERPETLGDRRTDWSRHAAQRRARQRATAGPGMVNDGCAGSAASSF